MAEFKPPKWAGWTQQQRHERARELLKEAGYDSQNPLSFYIAVHNTSDQNKQQSYCCRFYVEKEYWC